MRKIILSVAALMLVLSPVFAPHSAALEPGTVFFKDLATCQAQKGKYSTSFTRVVQGCTYSGRYLGSIKLDKGPYFIVFKSR